MLELAFKSLSWSMLWSQDYQGMLPGTEAWAHQQCPGVIHLGTKEAGRPSTVVLWSFWPKGKFTYRSMKQGYSGL